MSRLSLFDSPLFLGFDHFEQTMDRLKKHASEGYPPYNIEQIGENGLRITLAVAGFTMDELSVELEHNQLTIRGKQAEEDEKVYLHRGIASRQFQRSFLLADGIEILGAHLDNGLLNIDIKRNIPENETQKIEIISGQHEKNGSKKEIDSIDVETLDSDGSEKNKKKNNT